MDEIKMKLSTKFMKSIFSKFISNAIYKKYGFKIKLIFNDIDINFINGETKIHADADIEMDKETFNNLLNSNHLN